MLVFGDKGKPECLENNLSENQQTLPTNDAEFGNPTWATLVEGERCHHCTIPAAPKNAYTLLPHYMQVKHYRQHI